MKTNYTVNIDTVTYTVEGMDFHIPGTTTARLTNDEGEALDSYQNRISISGNHASHCLQVRTKHFEKQLFVEGSPYAYLYGQNVFTSSNLQKGVLETLRQVCQELGFKPSMKLQKRWEGGDIDLERVDLAVNFRRKSQAKVMALLRQVRRQLEEQGGSTRTTGATVYWTPGNGKEYSIGFYAKGPQMRRSKRFANFPDKDRLIEECETILRVELRLHASALRKLGLGKVGAWTEDTAQYVFREYLSRLRLLSVTSGAVTEEELAALPGRLRPVLAAHKAGLDLEPIFGKRTLQRHRADFRKLGIDLLCPNQPAGTVIPLAKVLSPKRSIQSAPKWMKEAGFVPPPADHRPPKDRVIPARSAMKLSTPPRNLTVATPESLTKTSKPLTKKSGTPMLRLKRRL